MDDENTAAGEHGPRDAGADSPGMPEPGTDEPGTDQPATPEHARDTPGATEPTPDTAYELLRRGQALLDDRHHAQAAIVLERADRVEPGKASILEALGRAYFNSGQHEPARATFVRLLDLDPSAHYAHFALGQSLKRLGRRGEAGTHLRLAVAMSPGSRLYRDALARLGSGPAGPPDAPANHDRTGPRRGADEGVEEADPSESAD